MSISLKKSFASLFLLTFLVFSQTALADNDWREITPSELQMKSAKVEADADAEAIFWEVRVDDSSPENLVMKHYLRIKVFTERGREKYSKIDIQFRKGVKIKDIMARVVKPDGSIIELDKNDVFEREIAKTDKIKVKAKSFAVPNIEPGVIVEYRYQEVWPRTSANNMRMTFQHDIPIQNITYYFKPWQNARYLTFNMADNKFIKDKNGFYRATMENVPAIKAEPNMPPEDELRSWLLLYYTDYKDSDASDFWARAGGAIVKVWGVKDTLKPGKELKEAANQIAAGAATDEEKIAKIFEFCRTKIRNITYDTTLTEEQKDEIKPSKSTKDTYKKLQGTAGDINELFASLATALGFEARLAFTGDRSEMFFNPGRAHHSFIHFSSIAVKINGRWRYYDPGSPFVPYGMLAWKEENTSALLLGYKDYIKTETPGSEVDKSVARRTGKFKLLEDGTLEGVVKLEYSGHLGYEYKMSNYESSPNKREEDLKEELKKQFSTADISDISIENVTDSEKPFIYQFKIRVPNYAQKTGKRLFLQPGFFEYGKSPVFSTAERKYPIYFHYAWSEEDLIEIRLPEGFELDSAERPSPITDNQGISSHSVEMGINKETNTLLYKRKFHFGRGQRFLFPAESYQALKGMFDKFHQADSHTITLKQN
jgi:hypothetical protein